MTQHRHDEDERPHVQHDGDHGDHGDHGEDEHHASATMAASATLHCLTGCATGEITGLIIGTALGLGNVATIPISLALAFLFGYTLSTLPLLKGGVAVGTALSVVLAADTVSILTMEVVDNAVMLLIPGAMDAGLVNVVFWWSMGLAFLAAFAAAFPVNRWLLARGKGHALTHGYHGADPVEEGWRRWLPSPSTGTLVAALVAFLLGGLVVSVADHLESRDSDSSAASAPADESTPA